MSPVHHSHSKDPPIPLETCWGLGAVVQRPGSESITAPCPHFMDGDSEARGDQCSPSRVTHTPGVLLSSESLLRVLLAHIYCAIFQLGKGGVLGWTVCPGQRASLQPLGTAQPCSFRADCALTLASCPVYIWSVASRHRGSAAYPLSKMVLSDRSSVLSQLCADGTGLDLSSPVSIPFLAVCPWPDSHLRVFICLCWEWKCLGGWLWYCQG